MKSNFLVLFTLITLLFLMSCQTKTESRKVQYSNDFENNNLSEIVNGKIIAYHQTKVLGNYNASGFELMLKDLPSHELVEITFDLYIHDSWDGNKESNGIDGPDIWKMLVDGSMYINATFSNTNCTSGFCPPQSYPNNYPNNNNNPKNGAFQKNLPGFCSLASQIGGSTLYQIKKTISHNDSKLILKCFDELVQPNAQSPLCDESWSVDNVKVSIINLN